MPHPHQNGKLLKFPPGFLWGAATSTTQIEGHINNEWTGFVARDGRTCHPACDSYHRYPEDIEWMAKLGISAYRMGIEWSRACARIAESSSSLVAVANQRASPPSSRVV